MTKRLAVLVPLLAVAAFAAAVEVAGDLARWPFRAPIVIDRKGEGGATEVELPPEVLDRARADQADLRVVAMPGGRMVGYAVLRETPAAPREPVVSEPEALLNRGYLAGKEASVTLDFGHPVLRNRLWLRTGGAEFRRKVRVEGAQDGTSWRVLRDGESIFRLGDPERPGGMAVKDYVVLPRNDFRFLRVTVFNDPTEPGIVEIGGASAADVGRTETNARSLATVESLKWDAAQDPRAKTTVLDIDLGFRNLEAADLTVEVDDATFQRHVQVVGCNATERPGPAARAGDPDLRWVPVAGAAIFRMPGPAGGTDENRTIDLPGGRFRFLRATIYNLDDAPLAVRGLTVRRARESILLRADDPAACFLYFGRRDAEAPQYDLVHYADRLRAGGVAGRLGDVEPNPSYAPPAGRPQPWHERHPGLLWAALLAAVAVLALSIARLVRHPPSP